MTVAELIEALRTLPQDALVLTDGYEGGKTAVKAPRVISTFDNGSEDYMWGRFEDVTHEPERATGSAVYIPGHIND